MTCLFLKENSESVTKHEKMENKINEVKSKGMTWNGLKGPDSLMYCGHRGTGLLRFPEAQRFHDALLALFGVPSNPQEIHPPDWFQTAALPHYTQHSEHLKTSNRLLLSSQRVTKLTSHYDMCKILSINFNSHIIKHHILFTIF